MVKRLTHDDLASVQLPMVVYTTSDTYGSEGELIAGAVEKVQVLEYSAHLPGIEEAMILVKDQFGCEDWYTVEMFFASEADAADHIAEELILVEREKSLCEATTATKARTALLNLISRLDQIGLTDSIADNAAGDCLAVINECLPQLRQAVAA
jgi:hypothetical protein